jgi:hypothetical protein
MVAGMNQSQIKFWLDFKSSQNSLLSPVGTSIWQEGLDLLNSLSTTSFFKPTSLATEKEQRGFQLLAHAQEIQTESSTKNFDTIGEYQLTSHSPLFRHLAENAKRLELQYQFTSEAIDEFSPWTRIISLGPSFYKTHHNRIKVPFYSLNHEHAHFCLFGNYYSNIEISDQELAQLLLLIEWACISLDLLLAFDLLNSGATHCLTELESITHASSRGEASFFSDHCQSLSKINEFASEFRHSFLTLEKIKNVDDMISMPTLEKHAQATRSSLRKACREVSAKVSAESARSLTGLLTSSSLTEIVFQLTGIQYE